MTPPASVAQGEMKATYVAIDFGIDAKRPPCIAALESDGAVCGDTIEALKVLALWQKEVVNAIYKGNGSGSDPFTSFLEGDGALPAGDHEENLIRWTTEKGRNPISREDAKKIIWEMAESDLTFNCDRAKKLCPSVAEFCVSEKCKRCSNQPQIELEFQDVVSYGAKGAVRFSPTKATASIIEKFALKMDECESVIYRYDGQIYRPDGERKIDLGLCRAAEDLVIGKNVQGHKTGQKRAFGGSSRVR